MADTSVQKTTDDVFEVGKWVGRREAFATLAGNCSAADAECLRQVRDRKQYRSLGMTWESFCQRRVGVDRKTAEKIIGRLEEFGPHYFTLAQVAGVTPEQFRSIAGSVSDEGLSHAGALIPIKAENAPKLIEAVKELRNQGEPGPRETKPEELGRAFDKCERLLIAAVTELERLYAMRLSDESCERLIKILATQFRRLSMVRLTES